MTDCENNKEDVISLSNLPSSNNTEEGNDIERRENEEITQFIEELQIKIKSKAELRDENIKCERPTESYFFKLDSSLKKNTAFVKKIKQFNATQLDALLKDMNTLNLTKYISEICTALVESKLKMTDVPAAVILCSRLHIVYSDFDVQFFDAWQKNLSMKPGEKISNASKLRVDLRLFAELVSSGVINTKQGLALLGNVLINIISQDKEDHCNFPIILSFCRHCGEEYAGLIPRRMQNLAEKYELAIPHSNFLNSDKQQGLRTLLRGYFKNLCQHLLSEQAELLNMTKSIRQTMESKGEISNDKKEKCEMMQNNFDKLLSSTQTLSDLLDEPMPELSKDTDICNPDIVIESLIEEQTLGDLDPWGDEETKCFYTELPDLRQFLPNFSAPKIDINQIEEQQEMTEDALDASIDADIDLDDPPSTSDCLDEKVDVAIEDDLPTTSSSATTLPDKISFALMEAGRANSNGNNSPKQNFEQFLRNLNNCVNKELIDSAAIEYLLNYNTKNNRKKLTKTIFAVQRTRLDILPFFSRFVAIVNLCNTDVAIELAELLRKEFKWHIRKKNQLNIESKIKIVRFIGEMTKFGLFKKFDALSCLKMLLRDFQHHQIEMACAFMEVAGIFLYNSRDSRLLTNVFLDQMLRLKTATALDSRYSAQVESVYYLVKPPETLKLDTKIRPPVHEYIRFLIFEELSKANVDRCIKMMRRINWEDPTIYSYAVKCMSKAYLLRFPLIRCLADLVSGMNQYQPRAVTMVIDNVFEDIRAGLEIHSPKFAQRRIAMTKYLGELYNYKLIESTNILNTLYSIISLGVATEDGVETIMDPPDSLFRLKMACILLDTSGQYFTSNMGRKKLNYFIIFFQHYYWHKKSHPVFSKTANTADLFPILVDHMYRDCLHNLRPNLKLFKNIEQAKKALRKLRKRLYPQLDENLKKVDKKGKQEPEPLQIIDEEESDGEDTLTDDSSNELASGGHRSLPDEDESNTNLKIDWRENKFEARAQVKTKEDLEFEQMFERMAADSYQERIKENVKFNNQDIPVPMTAKTTKKSYEQILITQNSTTNFMMNGTTNNNGNDIGNKNGNDNGNENSSENGSGGNDYNVAGKSNSNGGNVNDTLNYNDGAKNSNDKDIPFVLMVRGGKGGKHQFKQFIAPSDSALAINLKLQEEKIREEKEKVKRLTLNITERIEEEDYQESLLNTQRMQPNNNARYNRTKFRHQKGAPDADLIFN